MTDSPRPQQEAEERLQSDVRRVLSRHYLAEVDRLNEAFLTDPDGRPNSGQREGDISHAQVNAVIRRAQKTILFGQQTRLRAGILMKEDERLPRFHAGHEVVRYFYGAIRLIPEYLLDAIFERGISVTMVKGVSLLVDRGPRCHQSFHTGRTRKTIYLPEGVLMAAFEGKYHPWAFSVVLLQEAWKLLDYYLIVELVRRCQTWMHQHHGVHGFYFIKDTLLSLNKHRRISGEHEQTMRRRFRRGSRRGQRRQTEQYNEYDVVSTDTEFMQFYRHYFYDFYDWHRPGEHKRLASTRPVQEQATVDDHDILLRDPYLVGNETFDERRETAWAASKIGALQDAFGYPSTYHVDRDIVHPIALASATRRGEPLEPRSVDDLIHDLRDVARFGVDREARSDGLFDQLLETGLPGIVAFYDAVADEHADGKAYLTDTSDGFDAVAMCQRKIQRLSTTGPEGVPNSVGKDVRDYLGLRLLRQIGVEFEGFMALPKRERIEGRYVLRALMLKALQLARPELDEATREEMVAPPAHDLGPSYHVRKLADVAEGVLRRQPAERETELLFALLRKMDLHPRYHDVLLPQARQLCQDDTLEWGGDNRRALLADLRALVPDNAHAASSDPAGVRARLNRFDFLRRTAAGGEEQLDYLVGVLMRLDRLEEYEQLVERVIEIGERSTAALVEIAEQIDPAETHRQRIRRAAARALKEVTSATG